MKTVNYIVTLICFGFFYEGKSEIGVSLLGGINISNLEHKYGLEDEYFKGYQLGTYFEKNISKNVLLETGIYFKNKWKSETKHSIDLYVYEYVNYEHEYEDKIRTKLFYINIPVIAKYLINIEKSLIMLGIGPEISHTIYGYKIFKAEKVELDDAALIFNYGVIGKVGYSYPISNNEVFIQLMYHHGLTNMNTCINESIMPPPYNGKIYNYSYDLCADDKAYSRDLNISIVYKIPI